MHVWRFGNLNASRQLGRAVVPRARQVEATGRLLFMRSQFGHMEIITQRAVIPSVLQMTPLNAVNTVS